MSTTFSGKKEQHDADLRDQIELLRKKFKIRDLKLEPLIADKNAASAKRSKSVDSLKQKRQTKLKQLAKARSFSAETRKAKSASSSNLNSSDSTDKLKYTDILKKNLSRSSSGPDISRHSPTPSILKTASSPRSRNEMMRKSVKFNEAENKSTSINKLEKGQSADGEKTAPKIEMNLNWIMSLTYGEQNAIKQMKTVEDFDKTIKHIDSKLVAKLDESENPASKKLTKQAKSIDDDRDRESKTATPTGDQGRHHEDHLIYVFECKQWLAKDQGDKKIERILKVTNILNSK